MRTIVAAILTVFLPCMVAAQTKEPIFGSYNRQTLEPMLRAAMPEGAICQRDVQNMLSLCHSEKPFFFLAWKANNVILGKYLIRADESEQSRFLSFAKQFGCDATNVEALTSVLRQHVIFDIDVSADCNTPNYKLRGRMVSIPWHFAIQILYVGPPKNDF